MDGSVIDLEPPARRRFEISVAKRKVKQILPGLDYLHNQCGYVHTGPYDLFLFVHLHSFSNDLMNA